MLELLGIYLPFGALVGLLAGLMGIGGAMIIVPILHYTLARQGVDPSIIHPMALATCMANILFTSSISTYAHHKRGVVPWKSVAWMVPGILAGSFAGSYATAYIPANLLATGFGFFMIYAALFMFTEIRPKPSRHLPGPLGMTCMGLFVGTLSGLLGIGGAVLTMPLLLVCNVPLLSAIAAAGAFGFPIALAGGAGYVLAGWGLTNLPPYSLGFVYLPALLGLVPASVIVTPIAVRFAHSIPQKVLRRCLGAFLAIVACRMIIENI